MDSNELHHSLRGLDQMVTTWRVMHSKVLSFLCRTVHRFDDTVFNRLCQVLEFRLGPRAKRPSEFRQLLRQAGVVDPIFTHHKKLRRPCLLNSCSGTLERAQKTYAFCKTPLQILADVVHVWNQSGNTICGNLNEQPLNFLMLPVIEHVARLLNDTSRNKKPLLEKLQFTDRYSGYHPGKPRTLRTISNHRRDTNSESDQDCKQSRDRPPIDNTGGAQWSALNPSYPAIHSPPPLLNNRHSDMENCSAEADNG